MNHITAIYSQDSEQAVIGGLLLDNNAIDKIVNVLRPEMFYFQEHKEIFKGILTLINANKPADLVTLADEVSPSIYSLSYLSELCENTPSAANIRRYAEIVRERWQAREALRISEDLKNEIAAKEKNIQSIVTESLSELETLVGQDHKNNEDMSAEEIARHTISLLDSRKQGVITGLDTGLKTLNNIVNLNAGDLVIVAGRPGMGKTLLTDNIAQHVALTGHVLSFSLEMSKVQLGDRMLSSLSKVPLKTIQSGDLTPEEFAYLSCGSAKTKSMNLTVDFYSHTFEQIRLKARAANRKHKLNLITIDYLQLMDVSQNMENKNSELGLITKNLKRLAKELNVPIMVLSQLNRGVEKRTDKRPMMSDLRDSGTIEQDADVVLMLYRDEYYNANSRNKGVVEVTLRKYRQGASNVTAYMAFIGECALIADLAHGWTLALEPETEPVREDCCFV